MQSLISISLVSHNQGQLVENILADLAGISELVNFEVILTLNMPEQLPFSIKNFSYPICVIENIAPKGFGANHNQAFQSAHGEYFCVINPDVRVAKNPFPLLLSCLNGRSAAVVGPRVVSSNEDIEDSARRFPTPLGLLKKFLGRSDGRYDALRGSDVFTADWIAGMFMLFHAEDFRRVGGFDEGFFLYYEDVDICARLWKAKRQVVVCPQVQVVHDAQRTSHRNIKYLRWHMASLIRYLLKYWLRLPHATSH